MYIDKKEVGQRIYNIRKKNGYSMKKFGELIDNAPKGSVNSWEKGVNLPNEKRLHLIAELGNISFDELLYGSFDDYIKKLVDTNLGIVLSETLCKLLATTSQKQGYTYGDDIELLRIVNGLFASQNLVTKERVIFYQPNLYAKNYYDGIIQTDNSVLVCRAYSEPAKNTLHILPVWNNEKKEENIDFFHSLEKLSLPHRHNYFTAGIVVLHLKLLDMKIIYYGINEKDYTAKISPYEYNRITDTFNLNPECKYTLNEQFYREVEKEAIYQQVKGKSI